MSEGVRPRVSVRVSLRARLRDVLGMYNKRVERKLLIVIGFGWYADVAGMLGFWGWYAIMRFAFVRSMRVCPGTRATSEAAGWKGRDKPLFAGVKI